MKNIFLLLSAILLFSNAQAQLILKSNKSNIKVFVNGKQSDWRISPEDNPDRLRVYCSKAKNEVVFQSDIDTAKFFVGKNDTIKFRIILKSKDIANTEIVGIKDLPNNIKVEEKVYWLSQIWAETKYNFVNIDRLNFNLDSLYQSYIPLVIKTNNDYEFFQVLKRFMGNLHDGHSEVSDNSQFYEYFDYIPLTFRDFNKRIYVASVRKIPEFDSTWIGAELIAVDEIPITKYLNEKIFPYISASTEQHMWMQAIYKLHSGFKDQPFKGTLRKQDGNIIKIEIQHNGEAIRTEKDKYWGPEPKYSRNIVELKWLESEIALVSFNRFDPEDIAIKEFDRIAKDFYKAKGLIIDLRSNGGGSTEVAWELQKYLTKGKYFLNYGWETRINDGVGKANGNWKEEYKDYYLNKAYRFEKPDTIFISDTLKRITCPIVILIGRFTFSAAEDFLVNIYECQNRSLLIGEETGGSTGSPLVLSGLPGGGYVRICTRRICYPLSGKRFVNCGVKPDIVVKQTIDDYLANKDVVLERGMKELKTLSIDR